MITDEQMHRAEREFASAATLAFAKARDAERSLENYTYCSPRQNYNPKLREKLLEDFRDADYEAESRSWILNLIQTALKKGPGVPHNAVCFYNDGDKVCAVFGDFVDLEASPAGFGATFEEALQDLSATHAKANAGRFVSASKEKV
jgi:hypothetical protein